MINCASFGGDGVLLLECVLLPECVRHTMINCASFGGEGTRRCTLCVLWVRGDQEVQVLEESYFDLGSKLDCTGTKVD